MLNIYLRCKALAADEKGQTTVEWCVMVGLVALALIAASPTITDAIMAFFTRVSTSLTGVGA